jgi:hypothetical protein
MSAPGESGRSHSPRRARQRRQPAALHRWQCPGPASARPSPQYPRNRALNPADAAGTLGFPFGASVGASARRPAASREPWAGGRRACSIAIALAKQFRQAGEVHRQSPSLEPPARSITLKLDPRLRAAKGTSPRSEKPTSRRAPVPTPAHSTPPTVNCEGVPGRRSRIPAARMGLAKLKRFPATTQASAVRCVLYSLVAHSVKLDPFRFTRAGSFGAGRSCGRPNVGEASHHFFLAALALLISFLRRLTSSFQGIGEVPYRHERRQSVSLSKIIG